MAIKNINNYTSGDGYGSPLNIRRGNPNPLDNTEIWPTAAAALQYAATDPTAYVGQTISYFYTDANGDEKIHYAQIIDTNGNIRMLDGSDNDVAEEITEKEIDNILFAVFG